MKKQNYPTDLTDEQWEFIKQFLPLGQTHFKS